MHGKVLIVDDEPAILKSLAAFLTRHGYDCDTAGTVDDAVSRIAGSEYGIVLLDKNMPSAAREDEGGMEVLQFVRAYNPAVPVIVMTGYATVESTIEAMRLGAFDYITKPFDFEDLRHKIDRIHEYQAFTNPENILALYRELHDSMLDIISRKDLCAEEDRQLAIRFIDERLDGFFQVFRLWEKMIMDQRETLARIAAYAEELNETLAENDPARTIIENIAREASNRL